MNTLLTVLSHAFELGTHGFRWSLIAGFYAALIAAVVLPIDFVTRRWFTPGQRSLLWAIVLMRLFIPIAPASPLSLAYWLERTPVEEVHQVELPTVTPRIDGPYPDVATWMDAGHTATSSTFEASWDVFVAIATLVWPIAAVAIFSWTILVNWQFSRRIHKTLPSHNAALLELWDACCKLSGVKKQIPIVVCNGVSQPAIMGIWSTRLLLPKDTMNLAADQLRMVMLHELGHVRRHDLLTNWMLAFIRCLHWWNPIYWIATSRFNALREQACDRFVLSRLATGSGRQYGELLLTLAQHARETSPWLVKLPSHLMGFILSQNHRRSLAARIRALPQAVVLPSRWRTSIAYLAILLVALTGLTDAKVDVPDEVATVFPGTFENSSVGTKTSNVEDLTVITAEYEFGKVLQPLIAKHGSITTAQKMIPIEWTLKVAQPSGLTEMTVDKKEVSESLPIRFKWNETRLVVTAPAAVHREVQRNLHAWEHSGVLQPISLVTRFVIMNHKSTSSLKIPWRYMAPHLPEADVISENFEPSDPAKFQASAQVEQYVPVAYAVLTPEQTTSVLRNAKSSLQAPQMSVFNGQQVFVSDVSQTPFVVSVEHVTGTLATANTPQIVVAEQGTRVGIRPLLSADHSRILLQSKVECSCIESVKLVSISNPSGHPEDEAKVQVPHVKRLRMNVAAEIESGHSLLLGTLSENLDPNDQTSNFLFLLITPSLSVDGK